uniref:Ig-like domain-containing protein n=1 Tax=Naja naja TaxID=35670 RepID=A0A8C6VMI4_NAJNA
MDWTLLLLLFSYSPGAMCQYTLTQEPALSVSLGEPVKLSCSISSGYHFSDFQWFQQKGGERPSFLLFYNTTSRETKFEGIPDRFTTRSGNNGYLTITNLQAEDEADYYCLMWYSSGSVFHKSCSKVALVFLGCNEKAQQAVTLRNRSCKIIINSIYIQSAGTQWEAEKRWGWWGQSEVVLACSLNYSKFLLPVLQNWSEPTEVMAPGEKLSLCPVVQACNAL